MENFASQRQLCNVSGFTSCANAFLLNGWLRGSRPRPALMEVLSCFDLSSNRFTLCSFHLLLSTYLPKLLALIKKKSATFSKREVSVSLQLWCIMATLQATLIIYRWPMISSSPPFIIGVGCSRSISVLAPWHYFRFVCLDT